MIRRSASSSRRLRQRNTLSTTTAVTTTTSAKVMVDIDNTPKKTKKKKTKSQQSPAKKRKTAVTKKKTQKDTTSTAAAAAVVVVPVVQSETAHTNSSTGSSSNASSQLSTVYETGACCLCHCALDYSDTAAFDPAARQEDYSIRSSSTSSDEENEHDGKNKNHSRNNNSDEDDDDDGSTRTEYIYRKDDPYIPKDSRGAAIGGAVTDGGAVVTTTTTDNNTNSNSSSSIQIYQPNNALVYCDTCHRWYHQMCHFIPIFILPSSAFTCLPCQYQQHMEKKKKMKKSTKTENNNNSQLPIHDYPISLMFQSPPNHHSTQNNNHPYATSYTTIQQYESKWEMDPVVIHMKSQGLFHQLQQQLVRRMTHTCIANLRRTKSTIDTYLFQSSTHTRNYHLGIKSASTSLQSQSQVTPSNHYQKSRNTYLSQELVQCIVAFVTAKYTIRTLLQSLEFFRNTPSQRQSWNALLQWTHQQTNTANTTMTNTTAATAIIPNHPQYNMFHHIDKEENDRKKNDFVQRIIFPFGNHHIRRWYPVTPEYVLDDPLTTTTSTVPYGPFPNATTNNNTNIPQEIHFCIDGTEAKSVTLPLSAQPTITTEKIKSPTSTVAASKSTVAVKPTINGFHKKNSTTRRNIHDNNNNSRKIPKIEKQKTIYHSNNNDKDNDSGISLDELKCCVCLCGECTDENDLVMCDGQNCYRAFHMRCIYPPMEVNEDDDNSDWFCPYCQTMADLLLKVQTETNRILRHDDDDEWERRRYLRYQQQQKKEKAAAAAASTKKHRNKKNSSQNPLILVTTDGDNDSNNDNDSLKSWENIHRDVFPEAEWEYQVAQRLKKQRGLRNHIDIEILLARIQGQEEPRNVSDPAATIMNENDREENEDDGNDDDAEDDNLDVDGNFDLYSYQEERRISRADLDDDTNSQVTLAELSVVELNVSDDELAALTDVDSENSDNDDDDNVDTNDVNDSHSTNQAALPRRRQSRRLRCKHEQSTRTKVRTKNNGTKNIHNNTIDIGRMDVANIITGKRKRFHIDYRKLNDALFHAIPANELDDEEDFVYTDPQSQQLPPPPPHPNATAKNATTKTATSRTKITKKTAIVSKTATTTATTTTTTTRSKSARTTKKLSKVPAKRQR